MPQFGTLSRFPSAAVAVMNSTAPWEVVASADSITVTGGFVRITGSTTINTLTHQDPYFIGPLFVINTDSSVGATGTSGNIQLATTLTRYHLFVLCYDPSTSKWYANAIS